MLLLDNFHGMRRSKIDRWGLLASLLIFKRSSSVFFPSLHLFSFTKFVKEMSVMKCTWWCQKWWTINVAWLHMRRCGISTHTTMHQNATICIYFSIYHPLLELCRSINQQINGYDTPKIPRSCPHQPEYNSQQAQNIPQSCLHMASLISGIKDFQVTLFSSVLFF